MFLLEPKKDDTYLAYLPLAHVFELIAQMTMLLFGIKVWKNSVYFILIYNLEKKFAGIFDVKLTNRDQL